jgi:hypothetical protein
MRHPERVFAVTATLTLGAIAAIAWGAQRLSQHPSDSTASITVGVGLVVATLLVIADVLFWKVIRLRRRARRPDQKIAAWTLSPETWAAFRDRNTAREAETPAYRNLWSPRVNNRPVEVLASRPGFLIDGIFIGVEPRGLGRVTGQQWLAGRPECLEFACTIPVSSGSRSFRLVPGLFRIPVEPSAREAAETAYRHYHDFLSRGEPSDPTGHRLVVRIATALAVIGLPLGALGFWMNANDVMRNTDVPALLALIGTMAGGGAALVALVVWSVMLRKTKRAP